MDKQFTKREFLRLTRKKPAPLSKIEPEPKVAEVKENFVSGCKHSFGYLSKRARGEEISSECITCTKSVDCLLMILKM